MARYLHSLEITHRDLKPTNILFKGATLKICDMVRATAYLASRQRVRC
jgi:serine/threonine protein kinase